MVKVQAFVSVCMAVRSARLAAVSGCWGFGSVPPAGLQARQAGLHACE